MWKRAVSAFNAIKWLWTPVTSTIKIHRNPWTSFFVMLLLFFAYFVQIFLICSNNHKLKFSIQSWCKFKCLVYIFCTKRIISEHLYQFHVLANFTDLTISLTCHDINTNRVYLFSIFWLILTIRTFLTFH